MPSNLSKTLTPLGLSAAEIKKIYGSIKTARSQTTEVRKAVIVGTSLSHLPSFNDISLIL